MNRCHAFVFAITLILAGSSQSVRADTSIGDGGAWLLLAGSAVVTGANLISMTLYDGSTGLGIAGAAIGTGLVAYALIKDVEDAGFFAAGGAVAAAVGAANFFVARSRKTDAQLSGFHAAPCIIRSEHAPGLELSYRW